MLPAPHRLSRAAEFTSAVRGGVRARAGTLVVHHRGASEGSDATGPGPARVGLIVGRAVGSSVVRHRVSRRLRAQLSTRLDLLPLGSTTVVRALPGASSSSSAQLGAALDTALPRVTRTRRVS